MRCPIECKAWVRKLEKTRDSTIVIQHSGIIDNADDLGLLYRPLVFRSTVKGWICVRVFFVFLFSFLKKKKNFFERMSEIRKSSMDTARLRSTCS